MCSSRSLKMFAESIPLKTVVAMASGIPLTWGSFSFVDVGIRSKHFSVSSQTSMTLFEVAPLSLISTQVHSLSPMDYTYNINYQSIFYSTLY